MQKEIFTFIHLFYLKNEILHYFDLNNVTKHKDCIDVCMFYIIYYLHSFNVVTRHFESSATDPPQIQTNTY